MKLHLKKHHRENGKCSSVATRDVNMHGSLNSPEYTPLPGPLGGGRKEGQRVTRALRRLSFLHSGTQHGIVVGL